MDKMKQQEASSLFKPLLWMTFFWAIIQLALLLPAIKMSLSVADTQRLETQFPWVLLPGMLGYIAVNMLLWFSFCAITWFCSIHILHLLRISTHRLLPLGISIWLLFVGWVYAANQYFFPYSQPARLLRFLFPPGTVKILFIGLSIIGGSILILAVLGLLMRMIRSQYGYLKMGMLATLGIVLFFFNMPFYSSTGRINHTTALPHVVIINLDSLRYDHVGLYNPQKKFTPYLDAFLKHTTHFSHAFTPLARTFPAWISLLSGHYPKETGARYNLTPQDTLTIPTTLAKELQKAGYYTAHAAEGNRYVNMTPSFGFDEMLDHRFNFNEMMQAHISAFPLTNLVSQTRLGKWLLPYVHGNRDAWDLYYPQSFLTDLNDMLARAPQKPLFLAIHLDLPHWPFVWAAGARGRLANHKDMHDLQYKNYLRTLSATDKQLQHILQLLKKHHIFDNSIILVFSDHGEAFTFKGDRLTSKNNYLGNLADSPFQTYVRTYFDLPIDSSVGHGADLLSASQTHILFAWHVNTKTLSSVAQQWAFPVTLVDVMPTILDLLNLPIPQTAGISLKPYLVHDPAAPPAEPKPRAIFLETGLVPPHIDLINPDISEIIEIGTHYFYINPKTGWLEMKQDRLASLLKTKQRAVLYDGWLLAHYPNQTHVTPVLLNMKTLKWTDNLTSDFAQQSPLLLMQQALTHFYGDEI